MIGDIITICFIFGGVSFVLLAALGALKFPDALTRMAAVSKASTLGLTLIFSAAAIQALEFADIFKAIATILILWISSPIAAHLIGRASVISHEKLHSETQNLSVADEIRNKESNRVV